MCNKYIKSINDKASINPPAGFNNWIEYSIRNHALSSTEPAASARQEKEHQRLLLAQYAHLKGKASKPSRSKVTLPDDHAHPFFDQFKALEKIADFAIRHFD